ncbi:MAG: hypothetical protein ACHQ50_07630 [Fimbriimonadales bacterium]
MFKKRRRAFEIYDHVPLMDTAIGLTAFTVVMWLLVGLTWSAVVNPIPYEGLCAAVATLGGLGVLSIGVVAGRKWAFDLSCFVYGVFAFLGLCALLSALDMYLFTGLFLALPLTAMSAYCYWRVQDF